MSVHKTGQAPERTDTVELLDAATLRSYIAKAKQFNPHIPEELTGIPQSSIGFMSMALLWGISASHNAVCISRHIPPSATKSCQSVF